MTTDVVIKVIPRAKSNAVVEVDGQMTVRVTAGPHDGQANTAVLKLLARHWRVPISRLSIVRGQASRRKVIRIA